ncbi:hypothetical protein ACIP1U_19400 [Cupriavidus sp. NPDC089707]|uniref:hypothetical protein n=1 Tax=Cupriavidus sp. NPDC089707 TaxID=3363963 RepID=UPI0037F8F546
MKLLYLPLAVATIMLPACATKPDLKTADTAVAKVSIENRTPTTKFNAFRFEDDFDCFGWADLVPARAGFQHETFHIPQKAYQSVGYSYTRLNGQYLETCGSVVTFKTIPNGQYLVSMGQENGCSVAVFDITTGKPIVHPFEKREKKMPFYDAGGPWCAPNDRYAGSSNYVKPRTAADR